MPCSRRCAASSSASPRSSRPPTSRRPVPDRIDRRAERAGQDLAGQVGEHLGRHPDAEIYRSRPVWEPSSAPGCSQSPATTPAATRRQGLPQLRRHQPRHPRIGQEESRRGPLRPQRPASQRPARPGPRRPERLARRPRVSSACSRPAWWATASRATHSAAVANCTRCPAWQARTASGTFGVPAAPSAGFHVPHARAAIGVGAPSTPGPAVSTRPTKICPAAACRSSPARPCTPVLHSPSGILGNEASTRGSRLFARPIFPSPARPG